MRFDILNHTWTFLLNTIFFTCICQPWNFLKATPSARIILRSPFRFIHWSMNDIGISWSTHENIKLYIPMKPCRIFAKHLATYWPNCCTAVSTQRAYSEEYVLIRRCQYPRYNLHNCFRQIWRKLVPEKLLYVRYPWRVPSTPFRRNAKRSQMLIGLWIRGTIFTDFDLKELRCGTLKQ